jgi:hypothetical protein
MLIRVQAVRDVYRDASKATYPYPTRPREMAIADRIPKLPMAIHGALPATSEASERRRQTAISSETKTVMTLPPATTAELRGCMPRAKEPPRQAATPASNVPGAVSADHTDGVFSGAS